MEGTHKARCVDYQWGQTEKGSEQIVCRFEIVEGSFQGRTITWFGYFTDKTWERTQRSLRFMGWTGDDLAALGPLNEMVEIAVVVEEYKGKHRSKVNWVNKIGGGQIKLKKPLDDVAVRAFAERLKQSGKIVDDIEHGPADANGEIPF